MRIVVVALGSLLVVACGGSPPPSAPVPKTPAEDESTEVGLGIEIQPEREAPPALSKDEEQELTFGTCNPFEQDLYDAQQKAMQALERKLLDKTDGEKAEAEVKAEAIASLDGKDGGLDKKDRDKCMALFEKRLTRALFSYDPAEKAARDAVKVCTKRVYESFGKQNLSFEMGAGSRPGAGGPPQGPFCPDDFPVPTSLGELPYKSSTEDWTNDTWTCLKFGLRTEQHFQMEYAAPVGENKFDCIARFVPRKGGAPWEIVRGGYINGDNELEIAKKALKRRMKLK